MSPFYALGIVGAALILVGFLLRKHEKWGIGTVPYQLLNLVGSLALVAYAWEGAVWPFVVLNAVWAADSFFALVRR